MQADTSFWDSLVFAGIDNVDVETVTAALRHGRRSGERGVGGRPRARTADASRAGGTTPYQRRLKDLPLVGQSVVIPLTVRRFICGGDDCALRTFAEPFARLAVPYALPGNGPLTVTWCSRAARSRWTREV